MNCAMCGLPIDDQHPAFGENGEMHAAYTCLQLLKAALSEAQKPPANDTDAHPQGVTDESVASVQIDDPEALLHLVWTASEGARWLHRAGHMRLASELRAAAERIEGVLFLAGVAAPEAKP